MELSINNYDGFYFYSGKNHRICPEKERGRKWSRVRSICYVLTYHPWIYDGANRVFCSSEVCRLVLI